MLPGTIAPPLNTSLRSFRFLFKPVYLVYELSLMSLVFIWLFEFRFIVRVHLPLNLYSPRSFEKNST